MKRSSTRNDNEYSKQKHKLKKRKERSVSREKHSNYEDNDKRRKNKHNTKNERDKKFGKVIQRKIKTEEEYDRRHDELSRRRKLKTKHIKQEHKSTVTTIKQEFDPNRDRKHIKSEHERYGKPEEEILETAVEKEQPNLGLSGALTEDTNTYRGVVIKYNEPPEARIPKKKWRLYPFKGEEQLKVLHLHRQSAFLFGKLRKIADIPIDHPSCSKQHAVFQFRLVNEKDSNGQVLKKVKPYIIDLESTNGTYLNNNRIDPKRYFEMKEQDVLKFGFSSREYVLLHDKCDTSSYVKDSSSSDE